MCLENAGLKVSKDTARFYLSEAHGSVKTAFQLIGAPSHHTDLACLLACPGIGHNYGRYGQAPFAGCVKGFH